MELNDMVPFAWLCLLVVFSAGFFAAVARNWNLRRPAEHLSVEHTAARILEVQKKQSEELANAEAKKATDAPAPAATIAQTAQTSQTAVAPLGWLTRLGLGLSKSRTQLKNSLEELFLSKETKRSREELLEKLFEILVTADVGVTTSEALVDALKRNVGNEDWSNSQKIIGMLKEQCVEILQASQPSSSFFEKPADLATKVVMMVGVNGVGKTTTTGKLAHKVFQAGGQAIVGAADTFRAAAVEQLAIWAQRSNAELVRLKEGADPASVAFEAVKLANSKHANFCFVDTAGRLHNRNDLMQELAKIKRVMSKEIAAAPHEVLLVLDATTGQNAIQQAKVFKEISGVTGVVLTKLDGTAKGGVALAIARDLQLPIRFIGVGEAVEDLQPFNALDYVNALFEG